MTAFSCTYTVPDQDSRPLRAAMLDEAKALTCGDRNRDYGEPVANMQHIADIFNAMTGHKITAQEVALFHVATKMARLAKKTDHHDSYVDGMAYLGIAAECVKVSR